MILLTVDNEYFKDFETALWLEGLYFTLNDHTFVMFEEFIFVFGYIFETIFLLKAWYLHFFPVLSTMWTIVTVDI